jgi:hypothetical protein
MNRKPATPRPAIRDVEIHGSRSRAEIEARASGPWVDLIVDDAESSFACRLTTEQACQLADQLARAATFAALEPDKED